MAVAPREFQGPDPHTPEGGGTTAAPGTTPTPGGVPGAAGGVATQSGGSLDTVGSIPALNVPTGQAVMIREGPVQFRMIWDRFEGIDIFRSATEIGELQNVVSKNALTDQQTLKKRGGSTDVNTSGSVSLIGLHEVSGIRELVLDSMETSTNYTESDAVNFHRTDEATIKVEGTNSMKIAVTGASGDGKTLKRDFGAGSTKDLSVFDYLEIVCRGLKTSGNTFDFGISEDDATYTSVNFAGTTTETWETIRLDISGLAAASRDAIRYLRITGHNGATAQTWYVDIVRAVKRIQHRLRAVRTSGSSTGGVRDWPAVITGRIDSDESGAWVTKGTIETLSGAAKMRAVDWLGTTYITLGTGGSLKYANGVLQVWPEAPPSHFIAMHFEKLWLLSQTFEPHGLRHSDVNSSTNFPVVTNPVGGNGGLFYVGRRYGYLPTGMRSVFGQLFIHTEGDCWMLTGADNSTWALQRAYPGAGTLSSESICVTDNGMLWHDGLNDRIILWKSFNVVDIGVPIRPDLMAIPAARKPWTAAMTDGRYYYLSYTRAGQTVNDRTYVLDTRLLRWHGPYEGDWVGFTSGLISVDGGLYVGTETNGVRKVMTGTSDNGAAIAMGWKSSAFNGRLPRWTKRIRRLWVKTENTTATVTANFYTDLSASVKRSYALAFTGAASETAATGVDNDVLGDVIQLELTESSTNAVTINEIGMDAYLERALR